MKTIATIVDRHGMTTVVCIPKSIYDVLNDNTGWELHRDLADGMNGALTGAAFIMQRKKLRDALSESGF